MVEIERTTVVSSLGVVLPKEALARSRNLFANGETSLPRLAAR